MGTMVDDADYKRVVRGHGTKGKGHEIEFKTLEDPTTVTNARW